MSLTAVITGAFAAYAAASESASMGSWTDAGDDRAGSTLVGSLSCFTSPPRCEMKSVNVSKAGKKPR